MPIYRCSRQYHQQSSHLLLLWTLTALHTHCREHIKPQKECRKLAVDERRLNSQNIVTTCERHAARTVRTRPASTYSRPAPHWDAGFRGWVDASSSSGYVCYRFSDTLCRLAGRGCMRGHRLCTADVQTLAAEEHVTAAAC